MAGTAGAAGVATAEAAWLASFFATAIGRSAGAEATTLFAGATCVEANSR